MQRGGGGAGDTTGNAAAAELQQFPSSERSDGSHASGDRPSASGDDSAGHSAEEEPEQARPAPAAASVQRGMGGCDYSLTDLAAAAEQGAPHMHACEQP